MKMITLKQVVAVLCVCAACSTDKTDSGLSSVSGSESSHVEAPSTAATTVLATTLATGSQRADRLRLVQIDANRRPEVVDLEDGRVTTLAHRVSGSSMVLLGDGSLLVENSRSAGQPPNLSPRTGVVLATAREERSVLSLDVPRSQVGFVPSLTGSSVWILFRDTGPELREVFVFDGSTNEARLVIDDLSRVVRSTDFSLVAAEDRILVNDVGGVRAVMTTGEVVDYGRGRAMLAAGRRWIRAVCPDNERFACELTIESFDSIESPGRSIRGKGIIIVPDHPILDLPLVDRTGSKAILADAEADRITYLIVDLATGEKTAAKQIDGQTITSQTNRSGAVSTSVKLPAYPAMAGDGTRVAFVQATADEAGPTSLRTLITELDLKTAVSSTFTAHDPQRPVQAIW